MPVIEIENLFKSYKVDNTVLKDVSLTVEDGEFVVFVGASGCGKTTLLKMINKLIPVSSGVIRVQGKKLSEWNTIQLRRRIGYVIQQVGLFPHMTVEKNIAYVPAIKGESKRVYRPRVKRLIERIGLTQDDLKRYPRELSGGQAQRIGVARALAGEADIVLMDEPFAAVDDITRRKLQTELKALHTQLKKTILFVTHDIAEALRLADKIVLFNTGRVEQIGTPEDMVFRPKSDYVQAFFGVKGFRASLSDVKLQAIYDAILRGEATLDSLFEKT